jgi:hypothetical protein
MMVEAYIALALGALLGAYWLAMHTGPGWPGSVNDPTTRSMVVVGWLSVVLLALSLTLAMISVVRS